MVSTKVTMAMMAVTALVCLVQAQDYYGKKCKTNPDSLSDEDKKAIAECYSEVTGKSFDPASFEAEKPTAEEKDKICECGYVKYGIIADGKFNGEKAKKEFAKIDADADTRKAVEAGIDACVAAGGDAMAIAQCVKTMVKKECGVKE